MYGMICLFAMIIIGQAVNLQIIQGDKWRKKEETLTRNFREIEAVRGNIYASDESLLATSIPKYEVRFDAYTDALTNDYFNERSAFDDHIQYYFYKFDPTVESFDKSTHYCCLNFHIMSSYQ